MTATTTLPRVRRIALRRIATRVRETLAEISYAQRRMAEIRMGLPLDGDGDHRHCNAEH